jgi:dTMP kinase
VRGAFVVLEGMDRSGKTTQVKLLQSRLIEAGRRVQLMRFPGELVWVILCWWGWVQAWSGGRVEEETLSLTAYGPYGVLF